MISKEPKKVILIDSSTRDVSVSETAEMARLRRENEFLQERIKSLGDPWVYRKAGLQALKENRVLQALGWFEKALVSDSSVISDDDIKQLPECIDLKDELISRVITDMDKIPEIQKRYSEFSIDVVISGSLCYISGEYYMRDEIRELSALSEQGKILFGAQSPLSLCIYFGYEKFFRHLVDRGADVNLIGNFGRTTLMAAGKCGYLRILKHLVEEKKVDLHQLDRFGRNVLFFAAFSGNPLMVKYLIDEKGMDINQEDSWQSTILFTAAQSESLSMVKYLVEERKMDISHRDRFNKTILFAAARSGSLPMVKYLVEERQMDIYQLSVVKEDILFAATKSGSLSMVKYLVEERGMDTSQRNQSKETPLVSAIWSYSLQMVKYLVEEKGMDISERNNRDEALLFYAVWSNSLPMVKYLVDEKEIDIGQRNQSNETALFEAAGSGSLSLVKYLVEERGMDTNQRNKSDETLLFSAVSSGSISMVRYLVEERGIDIHQLNFWKRTILFYAVKRGSLQIIKYFVEQQKMNIYITDQFGKNLLCCCSDPSIIEYLMDQGLKLTHEQRNTISGYRIQLLDEAEKVYRVKVSARQLIPHSEITLKEGSNETDDKLNGNNEAPTVRSVELESEREIECEQKGGFHL